jgi:hypothetical protein
VASDVTPMLHLRPKNMPNLTKRVLLKRWSLERARTLILTVYWLLAAYLFYIWSLGPVLWLCHARLEPADDLPKIVQIAYAPLTAIIPSFLDDPLDSYLEFWLGLNK